MQRYCPADAESSTPGSQVDTVDRGGAFLGRLTVKGSKPIDLGCVLLEAGLAKLHPNFNPDNAPDGRELVAAQNAARAARLKVLKTLESAELLRVPLLMSCMRRS